MPARIDFEFEELDADNLARLKEWHVLYCESFPNKNEQEPLENFQSILRLNENGSVQTKFGPYHEFVIAIRRTDTKEIIGGLNFGVVNSKEHRAAGFRASLQAIYLFIGEDCRGALVAQQDALLLQMLQRVERVFPLEKGDNAHEIAIFFEANNPLDMSEDEKAEDEEFSGKNPVDRYRQWLSFARPLAFNYVQPALSADKDAVKFLDLFYRGPRLSIPSDVLLRHLYTFDSISVLKGNDAYQNADFRVMAEAVTRTSAVALLPESDPRIQKITGKAVLEFDVPSQFPAKRFPSNPFQRLANPAYRRFHSMSQWLERRHILMTKVELAVGIVTVLLSLLIAYNIFGAYGEPLDMAAKAVELPVLVMLGLYLATRGIVNVRRGRLGHSYRFLSAKFRHIGEAKPEDVLDKWKWFETEILEFVSRFDRYGPIADDQAQWLAQVSTFSSNVYSERRWKDWDPAWWEKDSTFLTKIGKAFPQYLWAVEPTGVFPGGLFCNIMVPLQPSRQLRRIDVDDPEIDPQDARWLMGILPAYDQIASRKNVTLLFLRHLAIPDDGSVEMEKGLVAAMLLRLAVHLETVARNNDINRGLPKECTVATISASASSATVLQYLGFTLLQRAPAHAEIAEHDENLHRSNISLFAIELSGPHPDALKLRALLAKISAQRKRPSTGPSPAAVA